MGIREYLTAHLPSWAYEGVRRARRVLPRKRAFYERLARMERSLGVDQPRIVRAGPFAGMRYIDKSLGSSLIPKMLGSYELELHDAIERLINCVSPEMVVDIGCAEGYYAVGLALRCPSATVLAYDSSPRARKLCREMASLNGVADRLHVHGKISPERLRMVLAPGSLILCDCEGCERSLIDPLAVPEIANAHAIVELHDFIDPTISRMIAIRCAESHDIELVDSQAREPSMFGDLLAPLTAADRLFAMEEGRPGPMQWAVMTPKADS